MLMSASRSGLVVVDLQEKLMPVINDGQKILNQTSVLLKAAKRLDIPVIITEQYPKGLGSTEKQILESCSSNAITISKMSFSAGKNIDVCSEIEAWQQKGRDQIIVCGTETHICVLQTVMDFIMKDYTVFVVEDACGSRPPSNLRAGLKRMQKSGSVCVTTEMVIFEWLEVAGTDLFKELSKLIK